MGVCPVNNGDDMSNIYIMGFMGTGKTTVGRLLADKMNRQFVDLDQEIEKREDKKIAEIFDDNGEQYFRELETVLLMEFAQADNMVVATGGGSIANHTNLEIVQKNGQLVALMASPEEILKRTSVNSDRPLLNVENPEDTIKRLLFERAPFYMKANHIVETTEMTPDEVVSQIQELISAD